MNPVQHATAVTFAIATLIGGFLGWLWLIENVPEPYTTAVGLAPVLGAIWVTAYIIHGGTVKLPGTKFFYTLVFGWRKKKPETPVNYPVLGSPGPPEVYHPDENAHFECGDKD